MNRKTISILLLVAVIFISLSLAGYSFLVSTHSATLPMMRSTEGYDGIEPAIQKGDTPVEPATPSSSGLATSSYSAPVSASTSGQNVAVKQASSQQNKQKEADQITASN